MSSLREETCDAVERVLGLKPLGDALEDAVREVRVTFLPSFHAEVSLSVATRATEALLSVSTAQRSIWQYLNAQRGEPGFTDAWVKPATSTEVHTLAAPLVDAMDQLLARADQSVFWSGIALDGMPLRVAVNSRGQPLKRWSLRFAQDAKTPVGELAKLLIESALSLVQYQLSRESLAALKRYL